MSFQLLACFLGPAFGTVQQCMLSNLMVNGAAKTEDTAINVASIAFTAGAASQLPDFIIRIVFTPFGKISFVPACYSCTSHKWNLLLTITAGRAKCLSWLCLCPLPQSAPWPGRHNPRRESVCVICNRLVFSSDSTLCLTQAQQWVSSYTEGLNRTRLWFQLK